MYCIVYVMICCRIIMLCIYRRDVACSMLDLYYTVCSTFVCSAAAVTIYKWVIERLERKREKIRKKKIPQIFVEVRTLFRAAYPKKKIVFIFHLYLPYAYVQVVHRLYFLLSVFSLFFIVHEYIDELSSLHKVKCFEFKSFKMNKFTNVITD